MIIKDDRTSEEIKKTVGFVVATDDLLTTWGRDAGVFNAPGRSIVACPVTSPEDKKRVWKTFKKRSEFTYVRRVGGSYYKAQTFRLRPDDHLHIYNTKTSFRLG